MNITITLENVTDAKELYNILVDSEEYHNKETSFQIEEIIDTLHDFIEESGE